MNPSEFTIVSWISALTGEQSIDDISYWTTKRLNQLIFPLFNPENAFTLIAEPEK